MSPISVEPDPSRQLVVEANKGKHVFFIELDMAGGHSPGFHPHLPGAGYKFLAKALGASMWFFIFYRARQDGAKMLGKHPWDSHGHGHGNEGHH